MLKRKWAAKLAILAGLGLAVILILLLIESKAHRFSRQLDSRIATMRQAASKFNWDKWDRSGVMTTTYEEMLPSFLPARGDVWDYLIAADNSVINDLRSSENQQVAAHVKQQLLEPKTKFLLEVFDSRPPEWNVNSWIEKSGL